MTSTFCPGRTRPWSRTACRAVTDEIGTAAASTADRTRGAGRSFSARARAYFGEAALGEAEHLVSGRHAGDVVADRFHASRELPAAHPGLGRAQAVAGQADRVGQAGHQVPHPAIDTGRVHPQQHLIVSDRRSGALLKPQNIRGLAVAVLNDRLHRRLPRPVVRVPSPPHGAAGR